MAPSFDMANLRTFHHPFPLRPTVQLITLSLLINKISGFYGLLALLTGYHLSWPQLTMYIYSVLALILTLYLYPHIRKASPFQNLLLAHFYALDTIVNAFWTAGFGVAWFWVLASHGEAGEGDGKGTGIVPGTGTIGDTAGFTDPEHKNVSKVAVEVQPDQQSAVTYAADGGATSRGGLSHALFDRGSIASIAVIVALWALRVYFVFVVIAYARACMRSYIASSSQFSNVGWAPSSENDGDGADPSVAKSKPAELAANPFAEASNPDSVGWRGKLGRAMVSLAPSYWLGADKDEEWARGMRGTFQQRSARGRNTLGLQLDTLSSKGQANGSETGSTAPGTLERERRRRSGTGPPAPVGLGVPGFVGQEGR